MLILTRKEGQGFMIGRHTSLHIHKIKKNVIQVGISTPKGTPVIRHEVYERQLEKRRAAGEDFFPQFYRAWGKSEPRGIHGYALSLPDTASVRYDFEPINCMEDITTEDHPLDLYLFSTEGEADAFMAGVKMAESYATVDAGIVREFRDGDWLVLVDHQDADWQDETEMLTIHDLTLIRHEDTTNEGPV